MPDLLRPVRPVLLHRRTVLAVKSGLAAGLAWNLGTQLPGDLGEYAYYAAFGAISVIYPAVSDSFREASRATAAILAGALLAVLMQGVAWPNALTVGVIILAAVAVGGLPIFGGQAHWVGTSALFILVLSGDRPQDYILTYVSQILLGAAVGLAVNYLLLPPMNLTSLETAAEQLRRELIRQLGQVGGLLDDAAELDDAELEVVFEQLEYRRDTLRAALEEAERSRIANPRARRYDASRQALRRRSEGLAGIAFLVQDVGVVLREFQDDRYQVLDRPLRQATAKTFEDLADLLESPRPDRVREVRDSVTQLLRQVNETTFEADQGRYLAGLIAVSAQRCLDTVTSHLTVTDPPADDRSPAEEQEHGPGRS